MKWLRLSIAFVLVGGGKRNCKKMRDDEGYWQNVESYLRRYGSLEFSHGLCPDCLHELYPEYSEDKE